jgi:cytochrome c-type biogenesis protein CcmF
VRSGVLTSVHSFANDPRRGVFILAILVLFIGGGLTLFAVRASSLKQGGLFAPISREGALVFNNLFLTTACLTVLVGTLYPLALEALTGSKITVGGPFFNLTFGPLFIALMCAMPFGPLLAWKRGDLLGAAQRLMAAFGVGLAATAVAFAIEGGASVLAPFGVGLAFYVMLGAFTDLAERTGLFRASFATVRARALGLPRSVWGTAVAHFGIAVTLLGIICAGTWGSERIVALKPTQTVSLSGYVLTFERLVQRPGPNYTEQAALFTVRSGGVVVGTMEPAQRSFSARGMDKNEAALMMRGIGQLYLSLGETNKDGSIAIRLYYKPMVLLIWLGAVVMMLGGALSLSDRRLRVGAPKPSAKSALQPAE